MTMANVLDRPRAVFLEKRARKPSRLSNLRTAFRVSSYRSLHDIHCAWQEHCLVLRGKVMSYFLKQTAQEVVFHLLGRIEIRNDIEVEDPKHVVFIP